MSIYLTQLLCPQRHCIVAVGWDDTDYTETSIQEVLKKEMAAHGIQQQCGLCGSCVLKFETRLTPWKSIAEAQPVLKECEMEQALVREWHARRAKTTGK